VTTTERAANMTPSISSVLRSLTALFSIVLLVFAAVSLYANTSATILVKWFLDNGHYAWAGVLMASGEDRPDRHHIDLTYDNWTEICVWAAAGSSFFAAFFCVAKIGFDERLRKKRNFDGMVRLHHLISFYWTCELTF
jgi:hypothetical protein